MVLERLVHLVPEHLEVDRFGQVIVGTQPHGFDGRLDRAVGRDHQDERLGPPVPDVPHQVQPGARAWHLEVGDDELMGRALKKCPRFGGVAGGRDRIRFFLERQREPRADVGLVVDDQDAKGRRRSWLTVGAHHGYERDGDEEGRSVTAGPEVDPALVLTDQFLG